MLKVIFVDTSNIARARKGLLQFALTAATLRNRFTLGPEDPTYLRRALLVASASKLEQQVRAILILENGDCLEEAVSVVRVLVEVVINGLYLQLAEDAQVKSFLSFDVQKCPLIWQIDVGAKLIR